jgi:hypothetical protein
MGLKCRINYTGDTAVALNLNGTPSKLYLDALSMTSSERDALDIWAISNSEEFQAATGKINYNDNVSLDEVVRFIDSAKTLNSRLSPSDKYQVDQIMVQNGIETLGELAVKLNSIFKPGGNPGFDPAAAIASGLYLPEDIDNIPVESVAELLQKINGELLRGDFGASKVNSKALYKNPNLKTIIGSSIGVTQEDIEQELLELLDNPSSEEELRTKVKELPYNTFVEDFYEDDEFAADLIDRFKDVVRVPVLELHNGQLSNQSTGTANKVRNTILENKSTLSLEADIDYINSIPEDVWQESSKDIEKIVKEIEDDLIKINIDIIGLHKVTKNKQTLIDTLLLTKLMVADPSEANINAFSQNYDNLFGTKPTTELMRLPQEYSGKTVVRLYTNEDSQSLFENHGLIQIGENLYQKIKRENNTAELYEYLFQRVTDKSFTLPLQFVTTKDLNDKVGVIKDITKYVNSRETGLGFYSEEASLYQLVFGHSPLQNKSVQTTKALSGLKFTEQYLKTDFVEEFYQYMLQEKAKNSLLYNTVLKHITVNDKDITITGPITSLEGIAMQEELEDYFRLKSDPSTNRFVSTTEQGSPLERLVATNFPQEIPAYNERHGRSGDAIVTAPIQENYIRIGNEVFKKVAENQNNSVFVKVFPNQSKTYLAYTERLSNVPTQTVQNLLENQNFKAETKLSTEDIQNRKTKAGLLTRFVNLVKEKSTNFQATIKSAVPSRTAAITTFELNLVEFIRQKGITVVTDQEQVKAALEDSMPMVDRWVSKTNSPTITIKPDSVTVKLNRQSSQLNTMARVKETNERYAQTIRESLKAELGNLYRSEFVVTFTASQHAGTTLKVPQEVWDISNNQKEFDQIVKQAQKRMLDEYARGVDPNTLEDIGFNFMVSGVKSINTMSNTTQAIQKQIDLDTAQDLSSRGVEARKIKQLTGWEFNSLDGKWRYEIGTDNILGKNVSVRLQNPTEDFTEGQMGLKLSDLIDYQELFQTYPNIQNTSVYLYRTSSDLNNFAQFSYQDALYINLDEYGVKDEFNLDTLHTEAKKALLHEVQHLIQVAEGFARGGNELQIRKQLTNVFDSFRSADQTLTAQERSLKSAVINRFGEDVLNEYVKRGNVFAAIDALAPVLYGSLSGEVEARNVETRLSLPDAEKRNILLEETEDVARDQQIVQTNFLETPAGNVLGFEKNGVIYLDENQLNNVTTLHELTHVFQLMLDNKVKQGDETAQQIIAKRQQLFQEAVDQWKEFHKGTQGIGLNNKMILGESAARNVAEINDSLEQAKRMESEGVDLYEIEATTGWFKEYDQWRYFSKDVLNSFKIVGGAETKLNEEQKLEDVIGKDNVLFKYYPKLRDEIVVFYEEEGPNAGEVLASRTDQRIMVNTRRGEDTINSGQYLGGLAGSGRRISSKESLGLSLLHEVAHSGQALEGTLRGGSKETVLEVAKRLTGEERPQLGFLLEAVKAYTPKNEEELLILEATVSVIEGKANFDDSPAWKAYNMLYGEVESRTLEFALSEVIKGKDISEVTFTELREALLDAEGLTSADLIPVRGEQVNPINLQERLKQFFNPEYKNTVEDKINSLKKEGERSVQLLDFVENVLPASMTQKYKSLYELGARVAIDVRVETGGLPGSFSAAFQGGSVIVDPKVSKLHERNWDDFTETINHEIIHGLVYHGVKASQLYDLHQKLKPIFEKIKENVDGSSPEAKFYVDYIQRTANAFQQEDYDTGKLTEDLEELITFAFTNQEFAKLLDSIPSIYDSAESRRTIFDDLKTIIRDIINSLTKDKTLLDDVNMILNEFFDTNFREEDIAERNERANWGRRYELQADVFDQLGNDPIKIEAEYNRLKGLGVQNNFTDAVDTILGSENQIDTNLISARDTGKYGGNFAIVYNGTNKDFDKFSTRFIGDGQGGQLGGWGLYFTEKESRAKGYAQHLGKDVVKLGDVELKAAFDPQLDDIKKKIAAGEFTKLGLVKEFLKVSSDFRDQASRLRGEKMDSDGNFIEKEDELEYNYLSSEFRRYKGYAKEVLKNEPSIERKQRFLYAVDMQDNLTFLDFNKKVPAEQFEMLLATAKQESHPMLPNILKNKGAANGKDFYKNIADNNPGIEGKSADQVLSELLLRAGISGNKMRSEGTIDYIVFDESLVTIKEKIMFSTDIDKLSNEIGLDLSSQVYAQRLNETDQAYNERLLKEVEAYVTAPEIAEKLEQLRKDNPSLWEKVMDFINNLKNWLKSQIGLSDYQGDIMSMTKQEYVDALGISILKDDYNREEIRAGNESSVSGEARQYFMREADRLPLTLSVFSNKSFKELKGKQVSPTTVQQLLNQTGIKQIEKDLINKIIKDNYQEQKRVSYDELEALVRANIMPLERVFTSSYADYGMDRLGADYGNANTIILNAPIEHGVTGHFSEAFKTSGRKNIKYISKQLNDNTWVAVEEGYESQANDNNIYQFVGTAGTKEAVDAWIRGYYGKSEFSDISDFDFEAYQDAEDEFTIIIISKGGIYYGETIFPANTEVSDSIKQEALNQLAANSGTRNLADKSDKREVNKGMFGHIRVWQDGDIFTVAELQSDYFQKYKAKDHMIELIDEETDETGLNSLSKMKPLVQASEYMDVMKSIEKDVREKFNLDITIKDNPTTYEWKPIIVIEEAEGRAQAVGVESLVAYIKRNFATNYNTKDIQKAAKIIEDIQNSLLTASQKQFIASQKEWEKRMVRESIREAALSGAKVLRFPTPYTLSVIEGYIKGVENAGELPYEIVSAKESDRLQEGDAIEYLGETYVVIGSFLDNIEVVPFTDNLTQELREAVLESKFEEAFIKGSKIDDNRYVYRGLAIGDKIIFLEKKEKPAGFEANAGDLYQNTDNLNTYAYMQEHRSTIEKYFGEMSDTDFYGLADDTHIIVQERTNTSLDNATKAYNKDFDKGDYDVSEPTVDEMSDYLDGQWIPYRIIGGQLYALDGKEYLKQPYKYGSSDSEHFDITAMLSEQEQTVAKKYEEIAEILKRERGDDNFRETIDEVGYTWYETKIKPEEVNAPVIAFQAEGFTPISTEKLSDDILNLSIVLDSQVEILSLPSETEGQSLFDKYDNCGV